MRAMNKNMEAMNKNMAKNMEEANKNFSTLVTNLKPEEMIDHIANRFDQTLAAFTEGTGNIQELVKNGNDVSVELLKFMSAFSPEELKDLSESIKSATTSMKGINDFMVKHSDNIDVLSQQMQLMPQLFVTMGVGMGMIDPADSESLIASLENGGGENAVNVTDAEKSVALDVLASAQPLSEKVMFLTEERMKYAHEHNYLRPLAELAAQINAETKTAGSIQNYLTKNILGKYWNEKDAQGNPIPVNQYITCAIYKMLYEMLQFKTTGSGKANVSGTIDAWSDGTMTMSGDISNLQLLMASENKDQIRIAYENACKNVTSFKPPVQKSNSNGNYPRKGPQPE